MFRPARWHGKYPGIILIEALSFSDCYRRKFLIAETSPTEDDRMGEARAFGMLPPDRVALAAYLGHRPARELLATAPPAVFSLKSMLLGGDRTWRTAMRALGHEPAAVSACVIAELALGVYLTAPDAPPEVEALARAAVARAPVVERETQSELRLADVAEKSRNFCVAVDFGGRLSKESGIRARALGRVVGQCYSVVLAADNRRHVRWLGEAAEMTCRHFQLPEATLCKALADVLLSYAIGPQQFAEFEGKPDVQIN